MAKELSQAELLDFLCQAGGRVANAALLGHFRRFLRDAEAAPDELQRRRERFKGFVNAVATVRQEGAAKFVVLRKRYRELVGEETRAPDEPPPPPAPAPAEVRPGGRGASQGPGGSGGGASRGEPPGAQVAEERTCRGPAGQRSGAQAAREGLPGEPERRSPTPPLPRRPESPGEPCALPGAEKRGHATRGPPAAGNPLVLRGGAPPPPEPSSPSGEIPGVPPSAASAQQRIREWLARAQAADHHSPPAGAPPAPGLSPPGSARGSCPSPSLDCRRRQLQLQPPALGARREQVPVFRSIRCQLSLQDLEDFIEQASSASEEGSSASGGSEGGLPVKPGTTNRSPQAATAWRKPEAKPRANGQLVPLTKGTLVQGNGVVREPPQSYGQNLRRPVPSEKSPDSVGQTREPAKARKVAKMSPPSLAVPLSSPLEPQRGCSTRPLDLDGPDPDGTSEHRSSLVPLEPREHAWLVKVATGSWMQARALLLEDPHLATQRDFVSGYTVLHWLAKHGNAQVLQDFVTGAREAGVALDVDVKSGCGYTPLHLAAMHGHQRVIRLLVRQLQCQTQVRDCSGKKPWQYLSSSTSGEVWKLLGAPRGQTIFPARPLTRNSTVAGPKGRSPELVRKISRKVSLAAYLKPQHIKWKMGNRCPPLPEND